MAGRGPAPTGTARRRNKPGSESVAGKAKKAAAARKTTAVAKKPAARRAPAKARSTRSATAPRGEVLAAVPPLGETYTNRVWDQDLGEHRLEQVDYLQETRDWYESWRTSTVAVRLERVHWMALRRAAKLVDRFERGDTALGDTIRKIEANFGGSPYDMQRLGYFGKGEDDDGESDNNPTPATPGSSNVVDLRARLSAKK